MGTFTLLGMRNMLKYRYNDFSGSVLSDSFLNLILNDGYKDVSIKGIAYESRISKSNITAGTPLVSLFGSNVIRPFAVTYDTGTGEIGLAKILPGAMGHIPTQGNYPQFWFPWGDFIVVDPVPDVSTYDLFIYSSIFPTASMTTDTSTPTNLPLEFHECVYLFAAAMCNLKLRQWGDFITDYNDYTMEVQRRKFDYIAKNPDLITMRNIPDYVEVSYGEPNTES